MKLIEDTLKVKGKYSMKRVLVAVTFPYSLWVGYRVVMFQNTPQNAVQIFATSFAFIVAVVVTGAYAKKQELKTDTDLNDSE